MAGVAGADACGYLPAGEWYPRLRAAVRSGERPDPRLTVPPAIPATGAAAAAPPTCVPLPNESDIFIFEDTGNFFQAGHAFEDILVFLAEPANALLAAEGDKFDFVGFWLNFAPAQQIGTAFYGALENDVSGLGSEAFNYRAAIGLAGDNVEGFVMMWNINTERWQFGAGHEAMFTRLVLAEEFQHRFGILLPDLLDGRRLQGDNGACGRTAHWNLRVDGQGCAMEMGEWWGQSPAIRGGDCVFLPLADDNCFNSDTGGPWSYTDLYLMGYVSAAEMDAGNSELRYLDEGCASPYTGSISHFSSADIIAAAGERLPASASAQKHFRTGWIMIHRPGDPPAQGELAKATGILRQWTGDWERGTLGRGLMNNTLREACNPQIAWRPVAADVAYSIESRRIVVPPGGARVTLELELSDWSPEALASYDATLDANSLVSGSAGALDPVTVPDASAGAFVDTGRTDFVFASVAHTTSVNTTGPDYLFSGATGVGTVFDLGAAGYAGTLILDVSPDAAGTFDVGFLAEPDTNLAGAGSTVLPALQMAPANIAVLPVNTTCEAAHAIGCTGALSFDNSVVSSAPDPPYPCGLAAEHDGTLWFSFTATATSERVFACGSSGRNATVAVYAGTCDSLIPLGCSEDECGSSGLLPDLSLDGLTVGETYLVQFSAWQAADRGAYQLEMSCGGIRVDPPLPDPTLVDAGVGLRSRYLSFVPGTPGRTQSIRVTVRSAPAAFSHLVGLSMWAGTPTEISENSGQILPDDAPGYDTILVAPLTCEPAAVDWGSLGLVHLFGELLIPGAVYDVQLVSAGSENNESAFSDPLSVTMSRWGDLAGAFDTTGGGWFSPDGSVDVATDVVAALDKFGNLASAPSKTRVDMDPALPDWKVNITDVVLILDAFAGNGYPFDPPSVPCP